MDWWRYSRQQITLVLPPSDAEITELIQQSHSFKQNTNRKIKRKHFGPIQVPITHLNTEENTLKIYAKFTVRYLFNQKSKKGFEDHGEKIYLNRYLADDVGRLGTEANKNLFIFSHYVPCTQPTHSNRPSCAKLLADVSEKYNFLRLFVGYSFVHEKTNSQLAQSIMARSNIQITQLSPGPQGNVKQKVSRHVRTLLSWVMLQFSTSTMTLVSWVGRNFRSSNP